MTGAWGTPKPRRQRPPDEARSGGLWVSAYIHDGELAALIERERLAEERRTLLKRSHEDMLRIALRHWAASRGLDLTGRRLLDRGIALRSTEDEDAAA